MESSGFRSRSNTELRQLTRVIGFGIAAAGLVLVGVIAYTGWHTNLAETEAERARIENSLNQSISRVLDQQKSVAWWDDAIRNVVIKFDLDFTANNFGLFLSETYGQDEVYILDSENKPIFAYIDGQDAGPAAFYKHAAQVFPVVQGLRQGTTGGLAPRPDTFGAEQRTYDVLKGLDIAKWKGNILLIEDKPAIVAAITIVPNEDLSLRRDPPYLLVSVVDIDKPFVDDLGRSLLLPDLTVDEPREPKGGIISSDFIVDDGRFAGNMVWTTKRPGQALLTLILPLVIIGVLATGILAVKMLRRLRETSEELVLREERATYQATHDALTGLPNRYYFAIKLAGGLGEPRSG